jgi:hypothetical protein
MLPGPTWFEARVATGVPGVEDDGAFGRSQEGVQSSNATSSKASG